MIELWQAEWCPWSHRVRQRLTELGLSYLVHQVPAERSSRSALLAISGQAQIPVLRIDGRVIAGSEAILTLLEEYDEPAGATEHRAKAAEKAGGSGPPAAEPPSRPCRGSRHPDPELARASGNRAES